MSPASKTKNFISITFLVMAACAGKETHDGHKKSDNTLGSFTSSDDDQASNPEVLSGSYLTVGIQQTEVDKAVVYSNVMQNGLRFLQRFADTVKSVDWTLEVDGVMLPFSSQGVQLIGSEQDWEKADMAWLIDLRDGQLPKTLVPHVHIVFKDERQGNLGGRGDKRTRIITDLAAVFRTPTPTPTSTPIDSSDPSGSWGFMVSKPDSNPIAQIDWFSPSAADLVDIKRVEIFRSAVSNSHPCSSPTTAVTSVKRYPDGGSSDTLLRSDYAYTFLDVYPATLISLDYWMCIYNKSDSPIGQPFVRRIQ